MPRKEANITIPETLLQVKNILGVFSAKGGVGKSAISLNIALSLRSKGLNVGLADADIYGPSQAIMLDASSEKIEVKDQKLLSPIIKEGIKFMSMGLISNEKMPVIWRGPMVSGAVLQLISQTDWGELDYLIIDTPPGTGDVQLTLLQKIPLKGIIIITTPQEVAISDTKKGIEMVKKLDVPLLGIIENMSWFSSQNTGQKYYIFGKGGGEKLSQEYGIDLLSQLELIEVDDRKPLYNNEYMKKKFDKICSQIREKITDLDIESKKIIPQINLPDD